MHGSANGRKNEQRSTEALVRLIHLKLSYRQSTVFYSFSGLHLTVLLVPGLSHETFCILATTLACEKRKVSDTTELRLELYCFKRVCPGGIVYENGNFSDIMIRTERCTTKTHNNMDSHLYKDAFRDLILTREEWGGQNVIP